QQFRQKRSVLPRNPRDQRFFHLTLLLYEFNFSHRLRHHLQEQHSVTPALDVGVPVGALAVADGKVDNLQVIFGGAEDQIEIAERVDLPEITAVGGDDFVIVAAQYFRAAKRVLDALTQQPGKRHTEEFVAQMIE